MAVTHGSTVRTSVCNFIVDKLDTTGGAASLIFQTSTGGEVATLTMSATAFGAATTAAVATANAITSDTNATGGTVAQFVLRAAVGSADIILGSVDSSGADINISSTSIGGGDTVQVTSLTYTAMA